MLATVLREVRTGATLEALGNVTPVPNAKFLTGARQHDCRRYGGLGYNIYKYSASRERIPPSTDFSSRFGRPTVVPNFSIADEMADSGVSSATPKICTETTAPSPTNSREVLHSEFRNYFRNVAAAVEKVVELSEVWWRKCMVFRKWIFGSFMFGSAYLNTKSVFFMFVLFFAFLLLSII